MHMHRIRVAIATSAVLAIVGIAALPATAGAQTLEAQPQTYMTRNRPRTHVQLLKELKAELDNAGPADVASVLAAHDRAKTFTTRNGPRRTANCLMNSTQPGYAGPTDVTSMLAAYDRADNVVMAAQSCQMARQVVHQLADGTTLIVDSNRFLVEQLADGTTLTRDLNELGGRSPAQACH